MSTDSTFVWTGRRSPAADRRAARCTPTWRYHDIVPDQRIASTYVMDADDVLMSASVVTVEFAPSGTGPSLTYTDASVYLDGGGDSASRRHGTEIQLDTLGSTLTPA